MSSSIQEDPRASHRLPSELRGIRVLTLTDKGFFPSTEYHKWVRRTSVSFSFFSRHIGETGIFPVLYSHCQDFPF